MASKAWYKPSVPPHLIAQFHIPPSRTIQIWTTTCIVTNFGMQRRQHAELPKCSTLINPANPSLTGVRSFPYFPRGGPTPNFGPERSAHPIMGYVTRWGGMDVGSGMMFPSSVIDGLVHQLGGQRLRIECSLLPDHVLPSGERVKLPVGMAVATGTAGDLRVEYDRVIHTAPPFYNHPPSVDELNVTVEEEEHSRAKNLLRSCYRRSFDLAYRQSDGGIVRTFLNSIGIDEFRDPENRRVAVPLIGAGCRGFPADVAMGVAGEESFRWLSSGEGEELSRRGELDLEERVLAFGLLESADAETLATMIDERFAKLKI